MNDMQRFRRRIGDQFGTDGCWMWGGYVEKVLADGRGGYGQVRGPAVDGSRIMGAHRFAWLLFKGGIPHGLEVAHRCDVRACVNPDHLFLATHQENIDDREAKGRGGSHKRLGERSGTAKLTEKDIRYIRAAATTTFETQAELARKFNVTQACISHIIKRKTWRHIS